MVGITKNKMTPTILCVRRIDIAIQPFSAVTVERQLLAPLDHRLVIRVETILYFAQFGHMPIDPRHQTHANQHRHDHPERGDTQHGRRKPRQVKRGTYRQHPALHQLRQAYKSNGH